MESRRHTFYAWFLLTVIAVMQVTAATHIHRWEPPVVEISCDDCSHHVHHSGHFTGETFHLHPCLSCQLNNDYCAEPAQTGLAPAQDVAAAVSCEMRLALPSRPVEHSMPRAPPARV